MKKYNKRVLKAIRAMRRKLKINQDVLAEDLGIKQPQYSRLENGKKRMTFSDIRLIAKKFKVHVGKFFDMADDEDLDLD